MVIKAPFLKEINEWTVVKSLKNASHVAVEKTTNISETMTKKVESTPTPVTKEKYSEPNLEKSTDTVDRIQ